MTRDSALPRGRPPRTLGEVRVETVEVLAAMEPYQVYQLPVEARVLRAERVWADLPPEDLDHVIRIEKTAPDVLALMRRDRIDQLPDVARQIRVDRMLAAHDIVWDHHEVAAFLGRPLSTVKTWSCRTDKKKYRHLTQMPPKLDERRGNHGGVGAPLWTMPVVLDWALREQMLDRVDLVPFEEPNPSRRKGRPPNWARDARRQGREPRAVA